ncbi:ATP-dependent DNA helicase [Pleurotus pulmonarius]
MAYEYEADYLDSDDFEAFLEKTKSDDIGSSQLMSGVSTINKGHRQGEDEGDIMIIENRAHSNDRRSAQPGPSKRPAATQGTVKPKATQVDSSASISSSNQNLNYLDRRKDLQKRIAGIESEIQSYDEELRKIQDVRALRMREKGDLEDQLEALRQQNIFGVGGNPQGKGKQPLKDVLDYGSDDFQWVPQLKTKLQKVFGIQNFRLCQQGACNANVDGRDVVCIMPTGGGKSLTYQLPALLIPGCTIVISPLIALIMDQVHHLREAGVEASMLTGATSKDETNSIYAQLRAMADGEVPSSREIKLLYVTPERVAKAKRFMSILDKLYAGDRLARFVIDEAHCVSQMGHSFRPDYRSLHVLKQMYPRVPIMALSATCPPRVLEDVLKILKMKPIVDGRAAHMNEGTVYFTAPLYRKNLNYKVLPKPSSSAVALKVMVEYILAEHKDESGIVYCLTKKDTEEVAKGLSENGIKSGVYHADVGDADKEALHRRWRDGKVKVVCATIAFGLGIDKGDVRFVLHHSKTLEAYYQESGRAGRDGKDADCVMFYRPQDAMRLSSMVCTDVDGQTKLYNILQFAQSITECRKVIFAKCFSHTSQLSMSSWATEDKDALTPCGHCDNCARAEREDSFERKDVTVQAWQLLKVVDEVRRNGGRVTMSNLVDLARGTGKATYDIQGGGRRRGKGKGKEQGDIDVDAVADGKVDLSKEQTEYLIIELLVTGYLAEQYHSTAYQTNVYLKAGARSVRLTRMSKERLDTLTVDRIVCAFVKHAPAKRARKSKVGNEDGHSEASTSKAKRTRIGKRKYLDEDEEAEDFAGPLMEVDEDDSLEEDIIPPPPPPPKRKPAARHSKPPRVGRTDINDNISEDGDDAGWSYSMRQPDEDSPPAKRPRHGAAKKPIYVVDDIVELSSD